jgi:hypothetical protein
MSMLRKLILRILILSFVFFLFVTGAVGQETGGQGECIGFPTIPGYVQDIEDWKPELTLYADSDEIAPGGSVNLWVEGGCEQSYSWSVTGTGYTLSQTPPWNDQRRMTLTCVSGT